MIFIEYKIQEGKKGELKPLLDGMPRTMIY